MYDDDTMKLLGKKYRRRWITGLLLLAYGSAGVLGYGLHAVWDCGHDHGLSHACSHEHHHHADCHHHYHESKFAESGADAYGSLTKTVDACPICEFLVQAQSPHVMEFAWACVGPVAATLALSEISCVAPPLGVHPARGPPLG